MNRPVTVGFSVQNRRSASTLAPDMSLMRFVDSDPSSTGSATYLGQDRGVFSQLIQSSASKSSPTALPPCPPGKKNAFPTPRPRPGYEQRQGVGHPFIQEVNATHALAKNRGPCQPPCRPKAIFLTQIRSPENFKKIGKCVSPFCGG
jgi:hypothetical protein